MKLKQIGMQALAVLFSASIALCTFATVTAPKVVFADSITTSSVLQEIDDNRLATLEIYKFRDTGSGDTHTNFAICGVVFSYLRIADIVTDSIVDDNGMAVATVLYRFADNPQTDAFLSVLGLTTQNCSKAVEDTNGQTYYYFQSDTLSHALQERALTQQTGLKNNAEDFMHDYNGVEMPETILNGYTKAENLRTGLYLLVETKVPQDVSESTLPFLVSLPMPSVSDEETAINGWVYDVTIKPKNVTDTPTLNKTVAESGSQNAHSDQTTGSAGDFMDYHITSQLPTITSGATMLSEYTFTDTIEGLTYSRDVVIKFYTDTDCQYLITTWKLSDGKCTIKYGRNDDGSETMEIRMTASGLNEINTADTIYSPSNTLSGYSNCVMRIEYTAQITASSGFVCGENGNPNEVDLVWRRSNTAHYDTLTDDCKVYTFALELEKRFSDNAGNFQKVRFTLQNKTDGYYVQAVLNEAEGVYYAVGMVSEAKDATKLVPIKKNGKNMIVVKGLEADAYSISEIATDPAYQRLRDPILLQFRLEEKNGKVSVSASIDGEPVNMKPDGNSVPVFASLSVLNKRPPFPPGGGEPPATGGTATIIITASAISGSSLVGMILLLLSRRKKDDDDETTA